MALLHYIRSLSASGHSVSHGAHGVNPRTTVTVNRRVPVSLQQDDCNRARIQFADQRIVDITGYAVNQKRSVANGSGEMTGLIKRRGR